jgi:uncharacterized protein with FMN-binding domain
MGNESISRKTFAKGLTAGVVAAASLGILSAGEYSINGLPTIGEGNGSYTPGTYTASAAGISSEVTVTCTFNETTITAIEADVSGETAGIGAEIGDAMVGKVLENQTAEVDAESGATITSDAFKAAVADCIAQASGETPAAEASEDTTEESAAEEESAAVEATAAVSAGSYTAGTYEASAAGISSDVKVTATFDESGITDITADVSGETAGIGADIGDEVIAQALDAQSAEIEGVSGATVTSDAFKSALADCIAQAAGGAAEAAEETESEDADSAATEEVESEDADSAATEAVGYVAGTYEASAAGISSDVTVTATFDESGITDITADVSGETAGIGADIGDEVIAQALDAQSAEIEGVSGATVTSEAFKSALADCIAQAAGGDAEAAEETESEDADSAATEEVESEDADSSATEETETETVDSADPAILYTPGTYTATAHGIGGDVEVTATFDETSIVAVSTYLDTETPGIGADIGDEVCEQILSSQSAEIDGVSGATVTSDAVKAAMTLCIIQAKGDDAFLNGSYLSRDVESMAAETDYHFTPGTYVASAPGVESDITVTLTVDETSIQDIEADVSGEPSGLGGIVDDAMERYILAAQTSDVDIISGATITCDAIKAATADAIAQASGESETEAASETETESETEA